MKSPRPYIGVTGFTARTQVDAALRVVKDGRPPLIMIGVLASDKTIRRESHRHGSQMRRYPDVDTIAGLFSPDENALNLIHLFCGRPERLFEDMLLASDLGGEHCHGLQLNVPWPSPADIEAWRNDRESQGRTSSHIVLQCGRVALAEVGYDPYALVGRFRQYAGLVDRVLLDESDGSGSLLDPSSMRRYLTALYESNLPMGYVVAGGLSAETIPQLLTPLIHEFPDLSIDAEGRLRNPSDMLDGKLVSKYIHAANKLVDRKRR